MISNDFTGLGLSGPLVDVLEKLGITTPTEIQAKTLPPAMAGNNIIASAETGSGKTAAFLLPIIERLKRPGSMRALILAPTRELAIQIDAHAKSLCKTARLRSAAIVGGEKYAGQTRALDLGVDILIATPGRLNDMIERGAVSLKAIEVFVLDEADRMLDMGFLPQVRRIMARVPRKRQTMLLTATLSGAIEQLAREMTVEWVRIQASPPARTVATLSQKAFPVLGHAKIPLLLDLLRQNPESSFLVFAETKRGADRLTHVLTANRHDVVTLHSDRSQSQRNSALTKFRCGNARVLVATDVAARGIDVDDIAFVVNYDVPATVEDYIHRVGRTARAGREGCALTLVSPEEEVMLASIERTTGVSLERTRLSGFSDGRSDAQVKLASEIALLRSPSSRSFKRNRASRH